MISQKANLNGLLKTFFPESAERSVRLLVEAPAQNRARVLRSHLQEAIDEAEIAQRDAVDRLVELAGWLELAFAAGYLETSTLENLGEVNGWLSDSLIRRYYELFYPQLLTTLFRLRIAGRPIDYELPWKEHVNALPDNRDDAFVFVRVEGQWEGDTPSVSEGYVQLLQLDMSLRTHNSRGFLRILDDFELRDTNGETFNKGALVALLGDHERLVSLLHGDSDAHPAERRAFGGMMEFLQFSRQLLELLRNFERYPLLQSAIWHQYAHWFHLLSTQTAGLIAAALDGLSHSVDRPGAYDSIEGSNDASETLADMAETQEAMRALTSSQFRFPLENRFFEMYRPAEYQALFSEINRALSGRNTQVRFEASFALSDQRLKT